MLSLQLCFLGWMVYSKNHRGFLVWQSHPVFSSILFCSLTVCTMQMMPYRIIKYLLRIHYLSDTVLRHCWCIGICGKDRQRLLSPRALYSSCKTYIGFFGKHTLVWVEGPGCLLWGALGIKICNWKGKEAGLERGKLYCNDNLGHPLGKSGGRMAHQVSPLKWVGLYTPPWLITVSELSQKGNDFEQSGSVQMKQPLETVAGSLISRMGIWWLIVILPESYIMFCVSYILYIT